MDRRAFLAACALSAPGLGGCLGPFSGSGRTASLQWSHDLPAEMRPALTDDTAFLDGDGEQRAYAIADGTTRWDASREYLYIDTVGATVLGIIDGGRAVERLDPHTGDVRWELDRPIRPIDPKTALLRDPILGRVDLRTGTTTWERTPDREAYLRTFGGDYGFWVIGEADTMRLRAVDTKTGDRLWTRPVATESPSYEFHDGTLYVGDEPPESGVASRVRAIDPTDGTTMWTRTLPTHPNAWPQAIAGSVLLVTQGHFSLPGPRVTALDVADGRVRWTFSEHLLEYAGSSIAAFITSGGSLVGINPKTGTEQYSVDVTNPSSVGASRRPWAVVGDEHLVTTDRNSNILTERRLATGEVTWEREFEGDAISDVAWRGETMAVVAGKRLSFLTVQTE